MSNHTPVIRTEGLSLRFGDKMALDNLNLIMDPGAIHAIVGANGAGKSTLFRILLGFLQPTAGRAWVLGRASDALTPADRGLIGFVNEEHTLPSWMRVEQLIAMQRQHYANWDQAIYDEVIGHYDVRARQRISELSRGERAGVNLAVNLAQQPKLLILDEPTLGLDVVAKRAFLEALLYSNTTQSCTVVYCSHQMDEIERVADNLVILERGALRHTSPPDDFRARVRYWIAEMPFRGPDPSSIPGLLEVQRIDGLHHYLVLDQDDAFALFLQQHGARSTQSMPVSLDRAVNGFLAKGHRMPVAA
ncbi:ABC transporter ATP-binding protein [Dyella tabacisoli]|uniref:ABC transporter ATP-binding protein n=1 Tax=Dyella tabacisoli TaxID=2282381 RepID=A0A369US27_9GAMM|nr:ABC transporter ATP-binding protein [Dyella tabacisoli]RDD83564.1 ABC transporter ATP-binding protein [Dyella tabacisoli]